MQSSTWSRRAGGGVGGGCRRDGEGRGGAEGDGVGAGGKREWGSVGRGSGEIGRGYGLREMGRGRGPLGLMPSPGSIPGVCPGAERGRGLQTHVLPLQGRALGRGAQGSLQRLLRSHPGPKSPRGALETGAPGWPRGAFLRSPPLTADRGCEHKAATPSPPRSPCCGVSGHLDPPGAEPLPGHRARSRQASQSRRT